MHKFKKSNNAQGIPCSSWPFLNSQVKTPVIVPNFTTLCGYLNNSKLLLDFSTLDSIYQLLDKKVEEFSAFTPPPFPVHLLAFFLFLC